MKVDLPERVPAVECTATTLFARYHFPLHILFMVEDEGTYLDATLYPPDRLMLTEFELPQLRGARLVVYGGNGQLLIERFDLTNDGAVLWKIGAAQ